MRDPWKFVAFPAAGVAGYLISLGIESYALGSALGIPETAANLLVIAASGLFAGFMIDEVIPAYVEKIREGGGAGGGMGGDIGGGDDFDFDE